jgi:hypothetical protein
MDKLSRPPDPALAGGSQSHLRALKPEQARSRAISEAPQRRWRRPGLRTRLISLAAAVVVAVAVSAVLVTGSSPPSSAQARQKIAAASTLSFKAGTIYISETSRSKGVPGLSPSLHPPLASVTHYYSVMLPGSGVSRLSYRPKFSSYDVTELDNASTGYVRLTSSRSVPVDTRGWVSYPLGKIGKPAPVPPGSPGGIGGDVGSITHLGTKTIDGVKVTGYGVTVSVHALIAEAKSALLRDSYRSGYVAYGIKRFPAQIWLDSRGRVRELRWTVHSQYLPAETNTELWSYSRTVATISFPPPGDVTAAASGSAAYDQAETNAAAGVSG